MTFSICVREAYADDAGEEKRRFGVAVTTRIPGIGTLCPFASANGAIATQGLTNAELGRLGLSYLEDGLAVDRALPALLDADGGSEYRQLHGVGREGTFAFSGSECHGWYGHREGENYTVAGNFLVGEAVVDATAAAYEASDRAEPLAKRLIDALEAGHAEGGDRRESLDVRSAAVLVETTVERYPEPYYDDLRVDATETPIEDLRETYENAHRGYKRIVERYGEAYENDEDAGW